MRSYQNYKSTGVQWLGSVPTHWKKIRFKDILKVKDSRVGKRKDLTLLSLTKKGVIVRDLSDGKGKFPKDYEAYKIVHPNDFILCLFDVDETPRTVGIAKHEGMITGAYDVFDIVGANREYIYYLYLSFDDAKSLKPLYKGLRKTIPLPSLRSSYLFLPTIDEQVAITDYIKSEVNKIDHLISETEKEISLLNELKQAEIAHMVTCGLNPNAPMKDSGIAWIGKIPAHWQITHLRKYLKLLSDKGHGEERLLSVTREQGVIVRNVESKEENHNFVPDDLNGYKLVNKGQFAINKMKSWQGSYGVSPYRGIVSPAYYVCDLKFDNKEYFNIAIRSKAYIPFFTQYSKGIRVDQWDLSPIALKQIPFIEPPKEEQEQIVKAIKNSNSKIEKLTAQLAKQISYLQELKQRVISDAVTGKIDVRNYNN
jgi:type I restriction enzyme S subunit